MVDGDEQTCQNYDGSCYHTAVQAFAFTLDLRLSIRLLLSPGNDRLTAPAASSYQPAPIHKILKARNRHSCFEPITTPVHPQKRVGLKE